MRLIVCVCVCVIRLAVEKASPIKQNMKIQSHVYLQKKETTPPSGGTETLRGEAVGLKFEYCTLKLIDFL